MIQNVLSSSFALHTAIILGVIAVVFGLSSLDDYLFGKNVRRGKLAWVLNRYANSELGLRSPVRIQFSVNNGIWFKGCLASLRDEGLLIDFKKAGSRWHPLPRF